MAWNMGGTVTKCDHREYGFAEIEISKIGGEAAADTLFKGLGNQMQVRHWTLARRERSDLALTCWGFVVLFLIRFGCPMAISCLRYQKISTLSDILIPRPMPLSLTIPNPVTASNSIQRSRTLLEERRSSVVSFSTSANVDQIGLWHVLFLSLPLVRTLIVDYVMI